MHIGRTDLVDFEQTWVTLQVAALQREVVTLRDSLQAKDTALANAIEDGSGQLQELQVARQELLLKLETAEQQVQVRNDIASGIVVDSEPSHCCSQIKVSAFLSSKQLGRQLAVDRFMIRQLFSSCGSNDYLVC